jgi:hypothetical protein
MGAVTIMFFKDGIWVADGLQAATSAATALVESAAGSIASGEAVAATVAATKAHDRRDY